MGITMRGGYGDDAIVLPWPHSSTAAPPLFNLHSLHCSPRKMRLKQILKRRYVFVCLHANLSLLCVCVHVCVCV